MAKETKIAWTDATFNPWRGCVKVSEGCAHCYAESWSKRMGKKIWGADAAREHASEAYWKQPLKWNKEAQASGQPFLVFCSSLADVCEDRDDLIEPRARLARLISETQHLTWLLVTKRPENFNRFFGHLWPGRSGTWPRNVWALTTVENNAQAEKRLPHLLRVPAVVLGVSYEPALELVEFGPYLQNLSEPTSGVDWVIAGGESGGGARPFDLSWARNVIASCRANGAAPFIKQLGAKPVDSDLGPDDPAAGRPFFKDKKGGDWDEWPEDLRVREFPRG